MAATRVPSLTASTVTLQGRQADVGIELHRSLRERRIACAEDLRERAIYTEFGLEHGRNIDFGEDAESFFSEGGTDGRLGCGGGKAGGCLDGSHADSLSICDGYGV